MAYKLILETGHHVPAEFNSDQEAIAYAKKDKKIVRVVDESGNVIWERGIGRVTYLFAI